MTDPTKDQAEEMLYWRLREVFGPEVRGSEIDDALHAVLSAPPEVLAAAMGGEVLDVEGSWHDGEYRKAIVLPPSEVDEEGE